MSLSPARRQTPSLCHFSALSALLCGVGCSLEEQYAAVHDFPFSTRRRWVSQGHRPPAAYRLAMRRGRASGSAGAAGSPR